MGRLQGTMVCSVLVVLGVLFAFVASCLAWISGELLVFGFSMIGSAMVWVVMWVSSISIGKTRSWKAFSSSEWSLVDIE